MLKITFQFPRRFRPPFSVGIKFTDHFPSVDGRCNPLLNRNSLFAVGGVSYAGRGETDD